MTVAPLSEIVTVTRHAAARQPEQILALCRCRRQLKLDLYAVLLWLASRSHHRTYRKTATGSSVKATMGMRGGCVGSDTFFSSEDLTLLQDLTHWVETRTKATYTPCDQT